jgi:hypothetical protein
MERVQQLGIRDVEFHRIGIPDEYVHHGAQDVLRAQYDLDANGIAKRVREFLGRESTASEIDIDPGLRALKARGATLGEVAEYLFKDVPEEELARLPGSDHVDEVVYGLRRTATK